MSEIIKISDEALARHEAGHAVLQVAYGRTLTCTWIDPNGNKGRTEFKPSMDNLEERAGTDFAGPTSQLLAYESSMGQYREACTQTIIFEQSDPRRIPDQYNALNWGNDILCVFRAPIGIRDAFKELETRLKAYLQRETVQNALIAVERLLLTESRPEAAKVQSLIESILTPKDKNPEFSRVLRRCPLAIKLDELK